MQSEMVTLSRITRRRRTAVGSCAVVAFIVLAQASLALSFGPPSKSSPLFRPPSRTTTAATMTSLSLSTRGFPTRSKSVRRRASDVAKRSGELALQRWLGGGGGRIRQRLWSSSSSNEDEQPVSPNGGKVAVEDAGDGGEVARLRKENKLLQERLRLLQVQNDQLLQQQGQTTKQQQSAKGGEKREAKSKKVPYEQRLILEDFEGEGIPTVDARGGVVDGWSRSERRYTEPWDDEDEYIEFELEGETTAMAKIGRVQRGEYDEDDDELGLSEGPYAAEDEVCEYDDGTNTWMSNLGGECPVEPNVTFVDAMKSRAYWLVGLLALQSCSGFILSRNELLLQDHPVIVYFLTMLVGAGGNAGNQASVRVIRGLALGTLNAETQLQFLSRELRMAFALSAILSLAGFVRATVFHTPFPETLAVTMALSMIVFSSICLGAVLPLLLQKVGVDPAHSSTTIQVVMDILGGESIMAGNAFCCTSCAFCT